MKTHFRRYSEILFCDFNNFAHSAIHCITILDIFIYEIFNEFSLQTETNLALLITVSLVSFIVGMDNSCYAKLI